MLIRRALVYFSALLWLWPGVVYAQSEALVEAYNQGQSLYEAGRYRKPFRIAGRRSNSASRSLVLII